MMDADVLLETDRATVVASSLRLSFDDIQRIPVGSSVAAAGLPVEFHCHGIGKHDFSRLLEVDDFVEELEAINRRACIDNLVVVITLFLSQAELARFERVVAHWYEQRSEGRLINIGGFGIEGPVLASRGGTPDIGEWAPTTCEWVRIGALGGKGLIYCVLSDQRAAPIALDDAVNALLNGGVRVALGHFGTGDEETALHTIKRVVELSCQRGVPVLTDHLFNDMPRRFKHAWRGREERLQRVNDLLVAPNRSWDLDALDDTVGRVPAAIIREAVAGRLTICLNFDGEHVDPFVLRHVVELVGAHRIIAMTDRVDRPRLKNSFLNHREGSSLWYLGNGTVAASKVGLPRQIEQMVSVLRLSDQEILMMTVCNPERHLPTCAMERRPTDWITRLHVRVSNANSAVPIDGRTEET